MFLATKSACRSLQRTSAHPLRSWHGTVVRRRPDGAVEVVAQSPDRSEPQPTEAAVGTVPGREIEN